MIKVQCSSNLPVMKAILEVNMLNFQILRLPVDTQKKRETIATERCHKFYRYFRKLPGNTLPEILSEY